MTPKAAHLLIQLMITAGVCWFGSGQLPDLSRIPLPGGYTTGYVDKLSLPLGTADANKFTPYGDSTSTAINNNSHYLLGAGSDGMILSTSSLDSSLVTPEWRIETWARMQSSDSEFVVSLLNSGLDSACNMFKACLLHSVKGYLVFVRPKESIVFNTGAYTSAINVDGMAVNSANAQQTGIMPACNLSHVITDIYLIIQHSGDFIEVYAGDSPDTIELCTKLQDYDGAYSISTMNPPVSLALSATISASVELFSLKFFNLFLDTTTVSTTSPSTTTVSTTSPSTTTVSTISPSTITVPPTSPSTTTASPAATTTVETLSVTTTSAFTTTTQTTTETTTATGASTTTATTSTAGIPTTKPASTVPPTTAMPLATTNLGLQPEISSSPSAHLNTLTIGADQIYSTIAQAYTSMTADTYSTPTGIPYDWPYPLITMKDLVRQCHDLAPLNRSPPLVGGKKPINIAIKFSIDRFLHIDDVQQSISVSGQMNTRWVVRSCKNITANGALPRMERIRAQSLGDCWTPSIGFRNSVDDISMKNGLFSDDVEAFIVPLDFAHEAIFFSWKRRGIFKAVCNLDLALFPLDMQNCQFQFNLIESNELVNLSSTRLFVRTLLSPGTLDQWLITDNYSQISLVSPDSDDVVSQASFFITLKRRPDYYFWNLLAPCFILTLLTFSTFLIPPDVSDRVCLNVYMVLAFAVTQTQVLGIIPETSQRVLLHFYIQLLAITCIFCTIHSILMLWLMTAFRKKADRQICGRFSLKVLLDTGAFVVALAIFLGASLFSAKRAGLF